MNILLVNVITLKDQRESMSSHCFKISYNRIINNRSSWKTQSVPTFFFFATFQTFYTKIWYVRCGNDATILLLFSESLSVCFFNLLWFNDILIIKKKKLVSKISPVSPLLSVKSNLFIVYYWYSYNTVIIVNGLLELSFIISEI